MTTITVQRPVHVNVPRATPWAAELFTALLRLVQGTRQVRAEQRAAAQRQADAAAVRAYANRYAQHDPRFAADLLAAADRHEAGL